MYKITNKTPHPYDIHTNDGVKVIAAFGTLEADFDPAYLEMIRLSFEVEEVTDDQGDDLDDSTDDDSADQVEDTDPADESESEDQPDDKPEDDHSESEEETEDESAADQEEEVEESAQEEAEEQRLEPKAEYEALTGKKPDGRWSEERVLAEIAKLRG